MQQFFYKELEPAILDMEEKIQKGCICTLTKGDELLYGVNKKFASKKKGYVLSVTYPSGEDELKDLPEWQGWTVGSESEKVAVIGGQLAWL